MKHVRQAVVKIAVAVLVSVQALNGNASVDPRNLVRNGDFEASGMPPPGWIIKTPEGASSELVANALTGAQALKITLPVAGSATVTTEPIAVTNGEAFLLTFWHRADGMSVSGAREGCDAGCVLVWMDAKGRAVGRTSSPLNYRPVPYYSPATLTATAPAGAVTVSFEFWFRVGPEYKGPPSAQFIDQVRLMRLSKLYIPPKARTWTYLNRMLAGGLQFVPDPEAAEGQAIVAPLATAAKNATLTWGQYTKDQSVGDYVAMFRLKVKDNTKAEPVAHLGCVAFGSANYGAGERILLATDFKQPGVYQDFALRFVRPEEGIMEFKAGYLGTTDLTFDKTTVMELDTFATDQEQAAIWLGEERGAQVQSVSTAAVPAKSTGAVLVLAGLGHQTYFPAQALSKTPARTLTYSYLARIITGYVLDQPFPRNLEQLSGTDIIVLANVPASALNGLMGRRTLRQFVERGGGLLVFGGPWSLGKGEVAGSAFEPALPIIITGPWDMAKAKSRNVTVTQPSPFTADLHWDLKPLVYYCQRTTARPGSATLLESAGVPLLVTGQYGKGRVAVFAGTYLGAPAADEVFFYEWTDYPILLSRVLQWLSKQRD